MQAFFYGNVLSQSGDRPCLRYRITRRVRLALEWCAQMMRVRELDIALRQVGVAYASQVTTYTSSKELLALYALGTGLPIGGHALEIGSHYGASTLHLAAALVPRKGHIYCVDTWLNDAMPDPHENVYAEFCRNIQPVRMHVTAIRKRSELVDRSDFECLLDLVLIDGDHRYEAVKRDIERFSRYVAPQGFLVFHDFGAWRGVTIAVGELVAGGEWVIEGRVDRLAWLRRKIWSDHEARLRRDDPIDVREQRTIDHRLT